MVKKLAEDTQSWTAEESLEKIINYQDSINLKKKIEEFISNEQIR